MTKEIDEESKEHLLDLANQQRGLLFTFLAYLAAWACLYLLPEPIHVILNILILALFVWCVVRVFRIVRLRYGTIKAVLACILLVVPAINLAVLAIIIYSNNVYFREYGLDPGYFGANPDEIGAI